MLYEGASDAEPNSSHLGVAASPDGITWERPASPSVSPSDCEDVTSIRMPRLLAVEEDWLLAFSAITGADEEPPIHLAAGQDPMHPSCAGAEVALSVEDLPDSGGDSLLRSRADCLRARPACRVARRGGIGLICLAAAAG